MFEIQSTNICGFRFQLRIPFSQSYYTRPHGLMHERVVGSWRIKQSDGEVLRRKNNMNVMYNVYIFIYIYEYKSLLSYFFNLFHLVGASDFVPCHSLPFTGGTSGIKFRRRAHQQVTRQLARESSSRKRSRAPGCVGSKGRYAAPETWKVREAGRLFEWVCMIGLLKAKLFCWQMGNHLQNMMIETACYLANNCSM